MVISKRVKDSLKRKWWKNKDKGPCYICDRKIEFIDAEGGHIPKKPKKSKQVPPTPQNTRLVCGNCNQKQHELHMFEYMKDYSEDVFQKRRHEDPAIDEYFKNKDNSQENSSVTSREQKRWTKSELRELLKKLDTKKLRKIRDEIAEKVGGMKEWQMNTSEGMGDIFGNSMDQKSRLIKIILDHRKDSIISKYFKE